MNKKEKQLFKALCSFKADSFDKEMLDAAKPNVLGHLFFNRMQAIAYGTLKSNKALGLISREFRNSLRDAYEKNIRKNKDFYSSVKYLTEILEKCTCKYAMLKGAYLCQYYPEGYRTSNDIDLLVLPEDVTKIGKVLSDAGFMQGYIRNGEFEPATRKEIIESKMTRGETVPYIKKMNFEDMKYLEVDINFSLDYKTGQESVLRDIIDRVITKEVKEIKVKTLDECDFFIHLCSHLYKEATTLPWVEMRRDMTLYKYCDIYMLLEDMTQEAVKKIFDRCKELQMEKVCAFVIIQTSQLFDMENKYSVDISKKILGEDYDFIHRVFSPKDKKIYMYTEKNVFERLFADDRKKLLIEV